jgi:hypothetical protein
LVFTEGKQIRIYRFEISKDLGKDSRKISVQDLKSRSFEDLDARNGMNRAPRSSRDLTTRSFENQLMGNAGKKGFK